LRVFFGRDLREHRECCDAEPTIANLIGELRILLQLSSRRNAVVGRPFGQSELTPAEVPQAAIAPLEVLLESIELGQLDHELCECGAFATEDLLHLGRPFICGEIDTHTSSCITQFSALAPRNRPRSRRVCEAHVGDALPECSRSTAPRSTR